MKEELRKFILLALIIATFLMTGTFVFSVTGIVRIPVYPVLYIVPFVMLITVAAHAFLIYAVKKGDRTFISKYISASGVKLMIYLAALLIYVFSVGVNVKFVMVIFLISYVGYSIAEVYSILKYLKK
jgi:hypothetical protein